MGYGLARLAAALVIGLFASPGFGRAQTTGFADAVTALAKDCRADIKKYCPGLNLGNNEIRNCLAQHRSRVSPTCTSTMTSVVASIQRRLQAQAGVFKLCSGRANRGVQLIDLGVPN